MTSFSDANDFQPLFDGMPVVLRLVTKEELLALVYYSENDDRFMLERPLTIHYENTEVMDNLEANVNITRVRTRFERWITLSDSIYFPVLIDHILTIAPLAETIMNTYVDWANKLYTPSDKISIRELKSSRVDDPHSPPQSQALSNISHDEAEEIRQSYFDFILHNFHPKGKPN